jgi:aminoglycoside phosphotransferase (APT) family kinase protein
MMIGVEIVRALIDAQFPQWSHLAIEPVAPGGWDNRSFRLDREMVVRLPSAELYADQVEREQHWLPRLAAHLPLEIPAPLAMGHPAFGYPWRWSIRRWIEGETVSLDASSAIAGDVAGFLVALQAIDPSDGPPPGAHNFFRGGDLRTYDAQTRKAIAILEGRIDSADTTKTWEGALATRWERAPVWVHGDIAAGNLLVRDGKLAAVIDFGNMAVGDPACDLAVAWTLFSGEPRSTFRAMLPFDDASWARARGWALWKALIVAAGLSTTNAIEFADPWHVIAEASRPPPPLP